MHQNIISSASALKLSLILFILSLNACIVQPKALSDYHRTHSGLYRNGHRFCRTADLTCQRVTDYSPPRNPVNAGDIDSMCVAYQDYKSCYEDETRKRCPPFGLNEYVDQSCADVEGYKEHAKCYTKVDKMSENFVSQIRQCHNEDSKAVEIEEIHLADRSDAQRCYMEHVEVRCSRAAFRNICGNDIAFKHFHAMGGHHEWSNRCIDEDFDDIDDV